GTAELMNERFVNVKVDREERPDVDGVYMEAVVAMSGHGGWPLTVFLTPEGEPFIGGTYFPPEPRHGMPSFRQVLVAVSDLWREGRDDVTRRTEVLVAALRKGAAVAPSAEPLTESLLLAAVRRLRELHDPEWGGFGARAPKFPPASTLELLLRRGEAELATPTLDGMALGGMYDVVGGGFHRYSVDERWLVPHFEKMLYDNALLVPAYLHAWLVTGAERYREVVEETVEYLLRELRLPGGGFASSQDADTDGVEGLTYTWAPGEGAPEELLEPFEGGRFILRGRLDPETRARLLETRSRRAQPGLDDKAIASWNGLALAALAEAARRLRRADWLAAARELGEFLFGPLSREGRLVRSVRGDKASGPGFLDDYANTAHGLYELHVATGELRWLEESRRLALLAVELFADDERGGFFLAPGEGEELVARQKELFDHPLPSGNSMLAFVLLRLARIWGDDELERRAVGVLRLLGESLSRGPTEFAWALNALDLYLATPRELAVIGPPESEVARAALEPFEPNAVVAFGPADGVPLLAGKAYVEGKPAVYVCERFACQAPATVPAELK
ncbi:MAG TPA: thioredoxin domain-containing protein, partial [Gaiellaceae bacterium]|nr:thioredoxin domain-containing protein [Gaiellaceae bacterium]